jgi:hypothetical protein
VYDGAGEQGFDGRELMTVQSNDTSKRGGVAGGVILIGIGMLALTGWWWPGIMLVIGCGLAAERLLKGGRAGDRGPGTVLGHPFGGLHLQHIDIPWRLVGPFVLVAVGLALVVRAIARN